MGFAEDKVYDYILKNLRNFRNIRVASLADSLSCLTDADRDELHSREETRGSQATVYRLYQHLRCRQGWVPDLIEALRHNNAGHLADELQHVYDSYRPPPRSSPAPQLLMIRSVSSGPSAASSVGAQTPPPRPGVAPSAPTAQQPHQEPLVGGLPPALPSANVDLDGRVPVQESLPKTLLEQESPRPPLPGSAAHDGASAERAVKGPLLQPTAAAPVASGTPGTGSGAHPVCVDNGCFGNAKHLQRGAPGLGLRGSLPPRDAGATPRPEQPHNEPEENSYVSAESPLRLEEPVHREGTQPPDSVPKNGAVPGSEPVGSSVDVRNPFLVQQQFDAEQKRLEMLRGDRGDEDAQMEATTLVITAVPRGTCPSSDTSLKPPVQEEKPPVVETAKSSPSTLTTDKVLPTSVDPLPSAAGGVEGTSGRTASRHSSATSVWTSCSAAESDVELSKPGVLLSVAEESSKVTGRCPKARATSSPFPGVSSHFTLCSDPLMVSTDSSGSAATLTRVSSTCPDPRKEEAAGASRDSRPPPSRDSPSLGTHELHVAGDNLEGGDNLCNGADALGNPSLFDSSGARDATSSSSGARAAPRDKTGASLPYVLTAVGIAVISVAAFAVYNRLQK
ncbi:MAVS protein, partial [Todus mexicanus]|nr:MAVS protein [Todus mexicanus]